MIFSLTLSTHNKSPELPINYQFPLSAAIYKVINRADEKYAEFLHNIGYQHAGKTFKLFTFSDINTPFTIQGDRLLMRSNIIYFQLAFHMPDAAEKFLKGLFINQQIEIADQRSKVVFNVLEINRLSTGLEAISVNTHADAIFQPLSPIVTGPKNEKGNYKYLSPADDNFIYWLLHNWKEKYTAVYDINKTEIDFAFVNVKVVFYKSPPKSRLITIKANSPGQTKVRGFMNFEMQIHAKVEALEVALNCGLGLHNAIGLGCVKIHKILTSNFK